MIATLLLAVLPSALPAVSLPLPGAPCVCFPLAHAGDLALPEKPLAKAGWGPERLVEETLRVVRGSDDVLLRAEAVRVTLQAMGHHVDEDPKDADANRAARRTLFAALTADLKRETELAPLSRAKIQLDRDLAAAWAARLATVPGVARVEPANSKGALTMWFDAKQLSAERLRGILPASSAPTIEPPSQAARAHAAITLAFAGRASMQLRHAVDFDPLKMAREATELMPKDAPTLVLAAMVWADAGGPTSAVFARDALRCADRDGHARKNVETIFGAFFEAETPEELVAKLETRIQRG